jgi:putative pyruvate formate lyase activating enzyme
MAKPSYTFLDNSAWEERIAGADRRAQTCELCPRRCGVNRLRGEKGFCGALGAMRISSVFPHHGEEPPISGSGGSGTVFFSHCTLKCVFCQNYQISHLGEGRPYPVEELAQRMLELQRQGCHNVNLVTPTHFLPWILRAVREAATQGLAIPLVYNCGGYELTETLELLQGVVDIYLPDMKYGSGEAAGEFSGAVDYVDVNHQAVRAMFRQVGALVLDRNGIATRGICIRHLVLPNGLAGSESVASFLASAFDPDDITISLMAQYRPLYRAREFQELNRPIARDEYAEARRLFEDAGIGGYYQRAQELDGRYVIDFTRRKHQRLR